MEEWVEVSAGQVRRFGPLVRAGLELVGVPGSVLSWVELGLDLNELVGSGPDPGLKRLAGRAIRRYADDRDVRNLPEVQREHIAVVEERVRGLLAGADRRVVYPAALRGVDQFERALVPDPGRVWDGFNEADVAYGRTLLVLTHRLVVGSFRDPQVLAVASTGAVRQHEHMIEVLQTTTAQHEDQLAGHEVQIGRLGVDLAELQEALAAELERRALRMVGGSRPVVVGDYVTRNETTALTQALEQGGVATIAAVRGMRGVGKSQLAAWYASQCEQAGWTAVIWVTATSRALVVSELADVARQHRLVAGDEDPELAAKTLLGGCLIVCVSGH